MADQVVFTAEPRSRFGKGANRQLRRDGRVPGIVYGGGGEPEAISLSYREIKRQIELNPRFFSTVYELAVGDRRSQVLAREAQLHPVTDSPLHIDFLRAEAGATVTVAVPVHFINELASPGLKKGGVLNIVRREVDLICPADRIPAEVTVDLTGYDFHESVHISAVKLPEGVRPTITDRDFTIASVVPPTVTAAADEPAAT